MNDETLLDSRREGSELSGAISEKNTLWRFRGINSFCVRSCLGTWDLVARRWCGGISHHARATSTAAATTAQQGTARKKERKSQQQAAAEVI